MATTKDVVGYIKKRIESYQSSADLYRKLARENVTRSLDLSRRADSYQSNVIALEYVLYFAENGEQHPDLVVKPIVS